MIYEALKDFKKVADVSDEILLEYDGKLPEDIINLWKEYGFGSFLNDYLKVINPHEYQELVQESYYDGVNAIPMMTTGFGDIIIWKPKDDIITLLLYRYRNLKVLESGCDYFFDDLAEKDSVLNDRLKKKKYEQAVEKYGCLEYDECFGYVPLLGLGGKESIKNIQKVKIKEHIELITQTVGKIE
ncbi:MAG: DUF1851 domain-containing protein [Butyrivibrio sp.]|nr:DUF1851 domain-containing protein [Muribaculum sp.]MCM1553809.1 DUF1851 domain-containing protein [Butyrivibrio sp.]